MSEASDEQPYRPVRVERRIPAPADALFRLLADPRNHLALDGSDMVRGAVTERPVTGAGDVFVMRMFYEPYGDYEMENTVVEYEPGRRIAWEPQAGRGHPDRAPGVVVAAEDAWHHRWGYELAPDGPDATVVTEVYDCSRVPADGRDEMADGQVWAGAMARTLERLEKLAAEAG